jgi:hypothetical protein
MALDFSNCDALRRVNDKHPPQQILAIVRDRFVHRELIVQLQDPGDCLSSMTRILAQWTILRPEH